MVTRGFFVCGNDSPEEILKVYEDVAILVNVRHSRCTFMLFAKYLIPYSRLYEHEREFLASLLMHSQRFEKLFVIQV